MLWNLLAVIVVPCELFLSGGLLICVYMLLKVLLELVDGFFGENVFVGQLVFGDLVAGLEHLLVCSLGGKLELVLAFLD